MTLKSAILAAVTGEAAQETDPYYNLVSLHLKGDVNTGRNYNAFSDASLNNFRLTNNGDVRGSSFSPYGTSWSAFFDGTTDYVDVTSAAFNPAGAFTIEFWFYGTDSATATQGLVSTWASGLSPAQGILIWKTGANCEIQIGNASTGGTTIATFTWATYLNQWNHFALVRNSSNSCAAFLNGTRLAAPVTKSGSPGQTALTIGRAFPNSASSYFIGYISNVSFVSGSNVYDPASPSVSVPTTPLSTSRTDQVLLACHANRFIDRDGAPGTLTVTRTGDTRISSFSPFLETDTITGSGYFDGTGDWLNCGSNAAFTVGTGAVTVEAWIYCTSLTNTYQGIMSGRADNSGTSWPGLGLTIDNSQLFFTIGASTSGLRDTSTVPLNQWVHVVGVRAGTNAALFVNGVRKASTTSSTVDGTTADMGIGRYYYGTDNYYFSGNISNARIVKGIAVYDPTQTSITVPSAPLTATQSAGTNIQAIPEFVYATFDSSASSVTLSNGNLTLTGVGGSGFNKANSTTAISSGKWYFEATLVSAGTDTSIGISQGNSSSSYPGQESTSYAYVLEKGQKFNNNSAAAYSSSLTTGDVFMCAVDLDNNKLFFGKNGAWLASSNPITGANPAFTLTAGTYRAVARPYSTNSATFNFGATTFAYTPPTGFTGLRSVPTSLLTLQERGAYNTVGFQDESEYQHVITRPSGANVAQGTFSPFSPNGWSVYWATGGIINYDTATVGSDFNPGSSNFTMEMWLIPLSTAATLVNWGHNDGSGAAGIQLNLSGNSLSFTVNASDGSHPGNTSVSISYTNWTHIALVRNGVALTLYVNGVPSATSSIGASATVNTGSWYEIGQLRFGVSPTFKGYLSNFRMNFNAVYTVDFSNALPTGPLTSSASTRLLILQSNQPTKDASSYNKSPYQYSNGWQLMPTSPFKPVAYDPQVHGGSGYFDGNLDYIQSPTDPAFQMGTGDYTLECWAYFTATPPSTFAPLVDLRRAPPNYVAPCLEVSNTLKLQLRDGSTGTNPLVGATTLTLNTWHHLAITRQSGTTRCFVNGVLDGTVTNTTNFNSTVGFTAGTSGDNVSGGYYFPGYLSSVRVLKGTALYTGNFTPPSGPLPLINNTSLLLNFTNGGVIDSTGKNVIETVGNAGVVTTTIKKYGSGSMYFDGTGDYLAGPSSNALSFGTDAFTIEGWVYALSTPSDAGLFTNGGAATGSLGFYFLTGYLRFDIYNGSGFASGTLLPLNQWVHVACVRSGNTVTLYQNGVSVGSATVTNSNTSSLCYVGTKGWDLTKVFNGYIDDLRITKGYARYVTGTGANANQMVFAGTNTLALPTKAFPDRGTLSTLTTDMAAPSSVEALVVGGGAGGGQGINFTSNGGGGGAGGFRELVGGNAISVAANTNYQITVGSGGGGSTTGAVGSNGNNSVFSTITSNGGGGGGSNQSGANGGSGGGGGASGAGGTGGFGNKITGTSTDAPTQGNNGGSGIASGVYGAGGGGGANATTGTGSNGTSSAGGSGGAGAASSITGISVTYAGGGGGGSTGGTVGTGGAGGGGNGSNVGGAAGSSATVNTGGGGGGGASSPAGNGGNGGSGVVILAYPTSFRPLKASLGLVYTIDTVTRPGYRVYRFTSGTGSISW